MDAEYIVLFLGVLAVVAERSYRLYAAHKDGEIDLDETRRLVDERAGGVNPPTWE